MAAMREYRFFVLLVTLTVHARVTLAQGNNGPIVTTLQGRLQGKVLDVGGRTVNAFLGIPYGAPPVGPRRFKPPIAAEPWDGIYNASSYPNTCRQLPDTTFPGYHGAEMWNPNTPVSEDCLYLNVWQPSPVPVGATVMVWIYGGGFMSGTSSLDVYDGRYLAATQGVIVASMNYRTGALGFLSFGNSEAPGNMGLMDQNLALTWIKENVASFGGDPNKVTIFGESAGAASVSYHVLSPMSRTLFQRAVMESASALSPWALLPGPEAYRRGVDLAKAVGCSTDTDIEDTLDCMRGVPAQTISDNEWVVWGLCQFAFAPVVDGNFLREHPMELLQTGNLKQTDVMVGFNNDEGVFFLLYGAPGFNKDTQSLITREQYLEGIKGSVMGINDISVDALSFQYTDWVNFDQPTMYRDAMDDLSGDYNFICPALSFGRAMASLGRKTYQYKFVHQASNFPWPKWTGVMHGYECEFVFGLPTDRKYNYTQEEAVFATQMMTYWANFAKTGNPNKQTLEDPAPDEWLPYTDDGQEYIILDVGGNRMASGPRSKQCALWDSYLWELDRKTDELMEQAESCTSHAEVPRAPVSAVMFSAAILLCLNSATMLE